MKLKNILPIAALLAFAIGCSSQSQQSPVDYVNPNMGNISHLLVPTFPTVHLPNSMMRVYPHRDDFSTDYIAGLPMIVPDHRKGAKFALTPFSDVARKHLSYENELTRPYSYDVYLGEDQIKVRFAPSHQSAIYQFTYLDPTSPAQLKISSLKGEMDYVDGAIVGYDMLSDNKNKVYIYAQVDTPLQSMSGNEMSLSLNFGDARQVVLRYAVSFISTEQAAKNLAREIAHYDVEALASEGRKIWNDALSKIEIEGGSDDEKTVFYTSLYRTYERPVNISEDGHYFSAFDGGVHSDGGRDFYVDDWLWDTYRATHPLRVMIDSGVESDIINSYISMGRHRAEGEDWLPTFPKITGDSHGMNSNHGIITILDAWVKGINNFDLERAYKVSRAAIEEKTLIPWRGTKAGELDDFYKENGYFPALREGQAEWVKDVDSWEKRQTMAVTLGTSYDHWALSKIAEELGKTQDAELFAQRGLNYRNVFNHETKFFHPKDHEGRFIEPFCYNTSGGIGTRAYYDENNGHTYRWSVEHNVADLVDLMGGQEEFCTKLDSLFTTTLGMSRYNFWTKHCPDQTGNVGQFSMGNEPSFHIPYLYNYAGQPWKSQARVRMLLDMWFRNDLMGVPGDEDGGGMSAFVVFSQLGFYPVTVGLPYYAIVSPVYTNSKMTLSNGNTFEVRAKGASPINKYIQSVRLNGQEWNKSWFSHSDIESGAVMEITLGEFPNKEWGAACPPPSGY
ncbi:MAG: GH92 family glycosyl hydrolase [Rikenellaceae bacterium]